MPFISYILAQQYVTLYLLQVIISVKAQALQQLVIHQGQQPAGMGPRQLNDVVIPGQQLPLLTPVLATGQQLPPPPVPAEGQQLLPPPPVLAAGQQLPPPPPVLAKRAAAAAAATSARRRAAAATAATRASCLATAATTRYRCRAYKCWDQPRCKSYCCYSCLDTSSNARNHSKHSKCRNPCSRKAGGRFRNNYQIFECCCARQGLSVVK